MSDDGFYKFFSFILIYLFNRAGKNLKTICTVQKVQIQFTFKKDIYLVT